MSDDEGFGGGNDRGDTGGGGGGFWGEEKSSDRRGGGGKKKESYVHPMANKMASGAGVDEDDERRERMARKRGHKSINEEDTRPKSSVPLHIQQKRAAETVFADGKIPDEKAAGFTKHTANLQFNNAVPNFLQIMKQQAAQRGSTVDPAKEKAFFKFADNMPTLSDKRAPLLNDDDPVADPHDKSKTRSAPAEDDDLEHDAVQVSGSVLMQLPPECACTDVCHL
jgi:hypothetical protein